MDFVSLASRVSSLIGDIGSCVANIKRGPQACESLQREISSIQNFLKTLSSREILEDDQFKELQNTLNDIHRWVEDVNQENNQFKKGWKFEQGKNGKRINEFLAKLQQYISRSTCLVAHDIRQKQEVTEKSEILEWLNSAELDYNAKHEASAQIRHAGTCHWLADDNNFTTWCAEGGFLWLRGNPGSGKTILACSVIKYREAAKNSTVVYHYCDFNDDRTLSPAAILRSLLIQLLVSSPINWMKDFDDLISRKMKRQGAPSGVSELTTLLKRASRYHGRTDIIIDALDECRDRQCLLECLRNFSTQDGLSVFVTSRKEQDILATFEHLPFISLSDQNERVKADVVTFITDQLQKNLKLCKLPAGLKEEVLNTLSEKADGMFRWVKCQLDTVSACRTPKGVRDALKNLPKGLSETYERILLNILEQGEDTAAIAKKSLMWLVGSARPLTLLELWDAIMIEPDQVKLDHDRKVFNANDILDICGGLIDSYWVVDEHILKLKVRLSHFTVQEFLEAGNWADKCLSRFHFPSASVQTELAILSLTYLLCDTFDGSIWATDYHWEQCDRDLWKTVLEYAVSSSHFHILHSQERDRIYKKLCLLWSDPDKYCKLLEYTPIGGPDRVDIDPLLFYAVYRGLDWVAQRILDSKGKMIVPHPSVDCNDNLLLWAVHGGHIGIVRSILDWLPDNNRISCLMNWVRDCFLAPLKVTPLTLAVLNGNADVVSLLLERGARTDVSAPLSMRTPLHTAAERGYKEIALALLDAGADVHSVDEHGFTPLHVAIDGRHLALAQLLVRAGADVNQRTKDGHSALHIATVCRQSKQLTDFLLSEGAHLSDLGTARVSRMRWANDEPWYTDLDLYDDTSEGLWIEVEPDRSTERSLSRLIIPNLRTIDPHVE